MNYYIFKLYMSTVNFAEPPSTRHLLLVEAKDNISREEISIAKFDRVDVIYCSRETLPSVADKMKQFNIKWRSVNMLFHGNADLDEESICIFGIKMSMNRNIMMSDPNVQGLINFTKAVCQFTDDSLYVYTCAVGVSDGLKELCLRLDKECNLKSGIFLSTNTTGNGVGQDWNVEWGTKSGFLTSGVHTNEIEHASVALFRDIQKLTFSLASNSPEMKIMVMGMDTVGKSSLTIMFAQQLPIGEYDPTIEDNYRVHHPVDDQNILFDIMDTAGVYYGTELSDSPIIAAQGFIVMFSIVDQRSYDEAGKIIDQVLRLKDAVKFPIILVGNKSDLEEQRIITYANAYAFASSKGCKYIECSAIKNVSVNHVFEQIARLINQQTNKRKSSNKTKVSQCTVS
jgi:Ras-related protein Rap-1B